MTIRRMFQRRGTGAEWSADNPTLAAGEFGLELDTGRLKIGDGSTAWDDQAYLAGFLTTLEEQTDVPSTVATDVIGYSTPADWYVQAISAQLTVTAMTGTYFILDLQESTDGGATWETIYQVPALTSPGIYDIPLMLMQGRRRWKYQAFGPGSPTATFSVTVVKCDTAPGLVRKWINTAMTPNVGGSTGTARNVIGCPYGQLTIISGPGAAVPPVYGLQVSADNNTWLDIGKAVAVPASTTITIPVTLRAARYARAFIKQAGTGATHMAAILTATSF